MELGDVCWTVLVQHDTSLLLQRLKCGTYFTRVILSKTRSAMGYHGHGMAMYIPAWDITNNKASLNIDGPRMKLGLHYE